MYQKKRTCHNRRAVISAPYLVIMLILVAVLSGSFSLDQINTKELTIISDDLELLPIASSGEFGIIGIYDTPGHSCDVFISGDFAFVSDESFLVSVNVSNPTQPLLMDTFPTFGNTYCTIVRGGIAYVADATGGFRIYNVTNPSDILPLGVVFPASGAYDLMVSGNYAYLASQSGLIIVDIQNPFNPTIVGNYNVGGVGQYIAIQNDLVALSVNGNYVYLFNVSIPSNPQLLYSYNTGANTCGMAFYGNYLYLSLFNTGSLLCLDIQKPTNPIFISSISIGGQPNDVIIRGNIAFVAAGSIGLVCINISNKYAMQVEKCYDTSHAYGLDVCGNIVYISDYYDGLICIQVAEYINPVLLSTFDIGISAHDISISGDLACLAANTEGIKIFNVSNPLEPNSLGNYTTPGTAWSVALSAGVAYVTDSVGLHCINITNPTNPTLLGSYNTPDSAERVKIIGDIAYVVTLYSGLFCINVSNPSNPTYLGNYTSPIYSYGVDVVGNIAYVLCRDAGLYCVNISNPTNPTFIGSYATTSWAWTVKVYGNLAYIANHANGLLILNISNPYNPTFVGLYDTPGLVYGIAVEGSIAYVPDFGSGFYCLNVSNPQAPTLMNSLVTSGLEFRVVIMGNIAYVAFHDIGLRCIQISEYEWKYTVPTNPPPTLSNVLESADPLILGHSETISVTVADADGVDMVWIEFEGANHTMWPVSGNVWEYSGWTPSAIGTYPYTIWANDTFGNVASVLGSITVQANSPPTLSNVLESAEPLVLGHSETINVTVTDADGVDAVWIGFEGANHTMWLVSGNVWEFSGWTPSAIGTYPYTIWANDTFGNMNSISSSLSVQNNAGPTLNNIQESADPVILGNTVSINVSVTDMDGINTVWIGLEGVNYTMWNIMGYVWGYDWIPTTTGTKPYTIWANDTLGNMNSISSSLSVQSVVGPSISNVNENADPLELGNSETITALVTDANGVMAVWIEFSGENHTMTFVSGSTWRYAGWMPSSIGTYAYNIWANNSLGLESSYTGSITVQDTTAPAIFNIIESADPLILGNVEIITVEVTDFSGLQNVYLEFSGQNHTMVYIGGNTWRFNSWYPNSVGVHNYKIWARDNNGLLAVYTGSITVESNDVPDDEPDNGPAGGDKPAENPFKVDGFPPSLLVLAFIGTLVLLKRKRSNKHV
jgi:hypothetical protein